jgi:hypothetical protein
MSLYDMNDAPEQRADGVIPDGSFVPLRLTLRPGGENVRGSSETDIGLFKASLTSDVIYLDVEFTVIGGPHAGRKLWQNFTVSGGKLDESGTSKAWNIGKATLRAILDSALALDPKDMSDTAKAKRQLRGFRDLDGIEFFAKLGVERGGPAPGGGTFPDKNKIAHVVVPGEPQYADLRAGREVSPAPSAHTAAAPPHAAPVWQQQAPAAAAKPADAPKGPAWLRDGKN